MNGRANAGRQVRVRWMPHHDHEIEVFDARTGAHLGRAVLADQADPEQIRAVQRARISRRNRLARQLKAVEQTRRRRYAAATTPEPSSAREEASAIQLDRRRMITQGSQRAQRERRCAPSGPA